MKRNCWFSSLFGFRESGYPTVKKKLVLEGQELVSQENNRRFPVGEFSTPSLGELRQKVCENVSASEGRVLKITHVAVRDIYATHQEAQYAGATFQVASQFNCLEFVSPGVIPESGVTGYALDHTQGPACSLACPAATVYRNYFARTPKGNEGQRKDDQINNLDGLEELVDNKTNGFWGTKNGYTNSTATKLATFNELCEAGKWEREDLLAALKIGLHLDVEVIRTHEDQNSVQRVNQAFCSGISISYSNAGPSDWETVARIVLDATYEATLLATSLNAASGKGSNIALLTFIGGGVFGNDMSWICDSIGRACAIAAHYDLDVRIAHYRNISPSTAEAIDCNYQRFYALLEDTKTKSANK